MTNDYLLKRDKMLKTINWDFKESLVVSNDSILKNMKQKKIKSAEVRKTSDLSFIFAYFH